MLGPPGSGKGTHGTRLSQEFGVEHVSSGDVLRAAVAQDTPPGRMVGDYLARGDLVPDDVLFDLMIPISVRATKKTGGFIADGFPRTLAQAERAYREIGIDRDLKLQAVVSLNVPEDVLMGRLLDRAQAQVRTDDTPTVIQHRLTVYHDETSPLIDYYRRRGILLTVDGDHPTEHVYAEIKDALVRRGVVDGADSVPGPHASPSAP